MGQHTKKNDFVRKRSLLDQVKKTEFQTLSHAGKSQEKERGSIKISF